LPEWLGAFLARVLRVKADVAQKMRVKLAKALAVTVAGKGKRDMAKDAREKARTAAQGKGVDMALGHLCLL
jgi:hypothetical protein